MSSTLEPRPPARERGSEDPWTVALRVVHDLRRDGVRVRDDLPRMQQAVTHAHALLEALGVHAEVPDDGDDGPSPDYSPAGWES